MFIVLRATTKFPSAWPCCFSSAEFVPVIDMCYMVTPTVHFQGTVSPLLKMKDECPLKVGKRLTSLYNADNGSGKLHLHIETGPSLFPNIVIESLDVWGVGLLLARSCLIVC